MHPAFSVLFLTTLIGAGQGLFLALYTGQFYALAQLLPAQGADFYVGGSALALGFLMAGLVASFFHLGRPERAWRTARATASVPRTTAHASTASGARCCRPGPST